MIGKKKGDLVLSLTRDELLEDRTLGILPIPELGKELEVLEDRLRDGKKIYGETAIPCGFFRIRVSKSPHLKRETIEIVDVPGFTGIRIHCGVRPGNTEGCPLVSSRGVTSEGGLPILIFDDRAGEDLLTAYVKSWLEEHPNNNAWIDIRLDPEAVDKRKEPK